MKIKINRNKHEKTKKVFSKRITLPNNLRLLIIGIIAIILLISAYNVYAAYQKPATKEESEVSISYTQEGIFSETIYLKNNTIYNNAKILPSGGTAFRQIINYINESFRYIFTINLDAEISGDYILEALLQTDIWSKTYTLVQNSDFNNTQKSRRAEFNIEFPINYGYYESIVSDIEAETGVTAPNPNLIIQCRVNVLAKTDKGTISKSFTPSISIPLKGKTIEITEGEINQIAGVETEKTTVSDQSVIDERNYWTAILILFIIILALSVLLTKSDTFILSKTEKVVKKILKKYNEWIVEIDKLPKRPIGTESVILKSLEELVKISEEIGKPIIHYSSENDNTHIFQVLDANIHYEYIFSDTGKLQKTVKCPSCKTKIKCEGVPGETVHVECPKCGKTGTVEI